MRWEIDHQVKKGIGIIMPRGKQSGIAYGQKKQQGQSDTEQLIQIASYIRKSWE